MTSNDILSVEDLDVFYDQIRALKSVCLTVAEGEIVSLIGANGAGKSTLLRAISGLSATTNGKIIFDGHDIRLRQPHELVSMGIVHVPEGRRVFGRLTVRENLQLGAFSRRDDAPAIASDMERVLGYFPRLRERLTQSAGTLSGGEQQMLAVARGLMGRPSLMLLDEPSMGIAPILVDQIFDVLAALNKNGISILLVEQNASMALALCHRAYVLETGSMVLSGAGKDLVGDERIVRSYLG